MFAVFLSVLLLVTSFATPLPVLAQASTPTQAQTQTPPPDAAIRHAIEQFMNQQIRGLPGVASFAIERIGAHGLLPCQGYDVAMTTGARAWGRSSVTVRCVRGAAWTLLVPVRIQVVAPYLITARPLGREQTVEATDLALQEGDLGHLPPGILTDPALAIGQVTRAAVGAGKPLRADMLKAPTVIRQGQDVKVVSRGAGFEVANEGRALNSATVDQVVQVRLASGQVVSGVATAQGSVEIRR